MWPSQKHLRIKINFFHLVSFCSNPFYDENCSITSLKDSQGSSIGKHSKKVENCFVLSSSILAYDFKQGQINSYSYVQGVKIKSLDQQIIQRNGRCALSIQQYPKCLNIISSKSKQWISIFVNFEKQQFQCQEKSQLQYWRIMNFLQNLIV